MVQKQRYENIMEALKEKNDLVKFNISGLNIGQAKQSKSSLDIRRTSDNDSDNYAPPDAKKGKYDLNQYNFYNNSVQQEVAVICLKSIAMCENEQKFGRKFSLPCTCHLNFICQRDGLKGK